MHAIAQSWLVKNSTTYRVMIFLEENMACNILYLPQLLCGLLIDPLLSDFWSPTHKCSDLEKSNRKEIILFPCINGWQSDVYWLTVEQQLLNTPLCTVYIKNARHSESVYKFLYWIILLKSSKSINTCPIDVLPRRIPAVSWLAIFIIGCPIQVCNLYKNFKKSNDT